ncbi:MAG TPA: aminotransferase class IV [Phycisphaerales bacterium]|nr:aminotransferase class IV [Phycisphaerales bacterium]
MATVFLNGRFVDQAEARVSAFDAGLQHGVGLFETMLGGTTALDETWVFRLDEHLERLAGSARELGLSDQLRTQGLYDAVMETVARAGHARSRVRLTITAGDLNLLSAARDDETDGRTGAVEPTVLIVAQPATAYPEGMFERGVMAAVADARANPLSPFEGHKTLNYWWRLRELQAAGAKGAAEAIVLQVSNHLCGGCVSNVFVVKGGVLRTPIARGEESETAGQRGGEAAGEGAAPAAEGGVRRGAALPSPVLPGVTRNAILELAELRSIRVERRMLTIEDLLGADEVFLTNSGWGVLPVVAVEAHPIGAGKPGELTRALRGAWRRAIEGESE